MAHAIPQPTGSYGVGKSIHHLIDAERDEKHGPGKRELLLYVYYPSHVRGTSAYAPDIMPYVKEKLRHMLNVDQQALEYLDSFKESTEMHAPLAGTSQKFPVLFFSPGMGDPVEIDTALLEEMASHGYVVIAINHTYGVDPTVFPDGRVMRLDPELAAFWFAKDRSFEDILDDEHDYWVQDAHFVINAIRSIDETDSYAFLKDRIDYTAMAYAGHSLGGGVALQISRERSDIQACIDLDAIVFGPKEKRLQQLTVPCMFIIGGKVVSDELLIKNNIVRSKYDQLVVPRHPRLLYEKLTVPAYYVTIEDAHHNSFSDTDVLKYPITRENDPVEILQLIRNMMVQFCDHYLKKSTFDKKRIASLPSVTFECK